MTARYGALSNFFLKITDLGLVLCALGLTIVLRYPPSINVDFAFDDLSQSVKISNALLGLALVVTWHLAFSDQGLYLAHRFATHQQDLHALARALVFCSLVLRLG